MDIEWRPALWIQHDLRGRPAPHILCYLGGRVALFVLEWSFISAGGGESMSWSSLRDGQFAFPPSTPATWLLSVIVFQTNTRSSEYMLLDEGRGCTDGNLVVWGQGCKAKKGGFCSARGLVLLFKQLRPAWFSIPPSVPMPCFTLHFFISLHLYFFSFR